MAGNPTDPIFGYPVYSNNAAGLVQVPFHQLANQLAATSTAAPMYPHYEPLPTDDITTPEIERFRWQLARLHNRYRRSIERAERRFNEAYKTEQKRRAVLADN